MASVPNMRPAAGVPASDGKASNDGEAATKSPFATLLSIGTPKAADAKTPAQATPVDLIAALQQAIAARGTGQGGADATEGDDPKTSSDGSSDGEDADAGETAAPDSAPADLLPLIEAQSAAPITAMPPPTPKTDSVPEIDGKPAKTDSKPVKAEHHPAAATLSGPQLAVVPLPLPATNAAPPAAAAAPAAASEAPIQAAITSDASAGKPGDKKGSAKGQPVVVTRADAETMSDTTPAIVPRAVIGIAPTPAVPMPVQTEKPAATAAAPTVAPPPTAPDPLAAMQAALATIVDPATPEAARLPGGQNGLIETPIADRVMTHQLDLARDSAWLDRLARDIATSADGDAPMRFKLHPEMLGQMRVELSQGDRGTSVRLTVESETARGIVTDAQPKLIAEARAQGVRIAETHVDLAGGSGGQAFSDPRRQEAAREPVFLRTAHNAADRGEAKDRPSRADRYA